MKTKFITFTLFVFFTILNSCDKKETNEEILQFIDHEMLKDFSNLSFSDSKSALFSNYNLEINWNEISKVNTNFEGNLLKSNFHQGKAFSFKNDDYGNPELFIGINCSEVYKVPVKSKLNDGRILSENRFLYYARENGKLNVYLIQYLYKNKKQNNEDFKLIFFDFQKNDAFNILEVSQGKIVNSIKSEGFSDKEKMNGGKLKSAFNTCPDKTIVSIQDCPPGQLYHPSTCQCEAMIYVPNGSPTFVVYDDGTTGPYNGWPQPERNYVLYTHIEYSWYGMDIYISSDDIMAVIAGSASISYIISKCGKTGIPYLDLILEGVEIVSTVTAIFVGVYDEGYGCRVFCPMGIPVSWNAL